MATLGITFAGAALSMGGSKASKADGPPIQASSSDEENFIKWVNVRIDRSRDRNWQSRRDFIRKAEAEEKAKHWWDVPLDNSELCMGDCDSSK
jgi:ATP synthase subunit K